MKQPVRHLRRLKQNGRVCLTCTTKDIILDGKIAKTKNDHNIYGRFYQHSTVAPPKKRFPDSTLRGATRHARCARKKQNPCPATSVAANA